MNIQRSLTALAFCALLGAPLYASQGTVQLTKLSDLQLRRLKIHHFDKATWTNRAASYEAGYAQFILADLLCTHNLIGMSRKEIEDLLGAPSNGRYADFVNKEKDCIVYACGRFFLQLHIEDNRVSRLRVLQVFRQNNFGASKWTNTAITE